MGRFDSSLTRVQPVFNPLYDQDASGKSWVSKLLKLGSHVDQSDIPELMQLSHKPIFELSADSPRALIKCLVSNTDRLPNPNYSCSSNAMRKLKLLMAGSNTTLSEAMGSIDNCKKVPVQTWWGPEGVTKVDCALCGQDFVVFIEGKRTEMGASRHIKDG